MILLNRRVICSLLLSIVAFVVSVLEAGCASRVLVSNSSGTEVALITQGQEQLFMMIADFGIGRTQRRLL
jgi:hypothetical protein